jgi:hypothetical protein
MMHNHLIDSDLFIFHISGHFDRFSNSENETAKLEQPRR